MAGDGGNGRDAVALDAALETLVASAYQFQSPIGQTGLLWPDEPERTMDVLL